MAGNRQSSLAHQPGARRGEEMNRTTGREAGRYDTGTTGASRPAGKATPRSASGIVTGGPIDPRSPYLQPA